MEKQRREVRRNGTGELLGGKRAEVDAQALYEEMGAVARCNSEPTRAGLR